MHKTLIQRAFAPLKKLLPAFLHKPIRSVSTAVLTPLRFSFTSGHFKSSLLNKAVDSKGNSIPWYSYPAYDFLRNKDFSTKNILEFGSGQSTNWWSVRANSIKSFEENYEWYKKINRDKGDNVTLIYADDSDRDKCLNFIHENLKGDNFYDLVIIDGLFRHELCKIALDKLAKNGCIICDNSEGGGYYFQKAFLGKGFKRIDFHGFSPGVVLKQSTSFFFKDDNFLFDNDLNEIGLFH